MIPCRIKARYVGHSESEEIEVMNDLDDTNAGFLSFSWLGDDPEKENDRFRSLAAHCDLSREFDVYIRQSQMAASGKRDSLLLNQKQIPSTLVECNIPSVKIRAWELDINKSGALPIKFRQDLAEIRDRIAARITGTVVSSDIARIFRDRTLKGPTEFASLCEMRRVKILTCVEDRWELLDMTEHKDRQIFLQECIKAAGERSTIKSRLGGARLRVLRENPLAWSGGPIGLGYAVTQRQRLSNGQYTRRELYIYQAHAELIPVILRASLRPEIITWPRFRDYCWDNGIVVPPFDESIRADVGPKSVLYNKGKENMALPYKLRDRNLKTILGNVLLIGDRLYGSGHTARHTLKVVREIEEAEGQSLDCKVREHRLPLDAEPVPELAILKSEEEHALFWEASKKWLPRNLELIRQSKYSIHPVDWPTNEKQSAGKAHSGQSAGGVAKHPWAGHVHCWKHGESGDGWPVRTHSMQFRGADCVCYKDHREGGHNQFCSVWGEKNSLASILTNLLIARVSQWLDENHQFLADIVNERNNAKAKIDRLGESLVDATKKRDVAMRTYNDLTKRMVDMDAEFAETQLSEYFSTYVQPAMLAIQSLERELQDSERKGLTTPASITEDELRSELSQMVSDRNLPSAKLSSLIDLFVEEVGVLTSRHVTESVIVVRWRDRRMENQKQSNTKLAWLAGAHDILLTWRNWNRDDREWTAEEDVRLQQLWPAVSGVSYEEIKAALLPGRAWNKIYRRAHDLRLTDGSRKRQWQIAARKSEETLADRNAGLGFMLLQIGSGWPDLVEWAAGDDGEGEQLWAIACGNDGNVLGKNGNPLESTVNDCSRFEFGGWTLPAWTEKRLKIVLSGLGYEPRCPHF